MTDVVAAALTLVLLALVSAAILAARSGDDARTRRHVNHLIVYVLVGSLAAGVFRKELWPFARWSIFHRPLSQPVHQVIVVGVDGRGQEHDIDRRAFEPFTSIDLYTWLESYFPGLTAEQKQEAAAYLLDLVNAARARALAGERVGVFDRYFGPFIAPIHIVHAKIWDDPSRVPPDRLPRLRVYLERWNVFDEQLAQGKRVRELIYDYPPAGAGR